MKRIHKLILVCTIATFIFTLPLGHAQGKTMDKILIMYYSRTGITKMTCEALQKALNAQMIEIKDLTDRSGAWGGLTGMLNTLFNMQTSIEPEHPDIASCPPEYYPCFAALGRETGTCHTHGNCTEYV